MEENERQKAECKWKCSHNVDNKTFHSELRYSFGGKGKVAATSTMTEREREEENGEKLGQMKRDGRGRWLK